MNKSELKIIHPPRKGEISAVNSAAVIQNMNVQVNVQNNNYGEKVINHDVETLLSENNLTKLTDLYIRSKPRKKDTKNTYIHVIGQFCKFLDDHSLQLADFTVQEYVDFVNSLSTKNYSIASMALFINVSKSWIYWLTKQTTLQLDVSGVLAPKGNGGHTKEPLSVDQQKEFMRSFDRSDIIEHRNYVICSLMLYNGLRIAEIEGLSWKDVNKEKTGLKILGKARAAKEFIKLHEMVFGELMAYLTTDRKERDYISDDPLFMAYGVNGGGRLSRRAISRIVADRLKALGMKSDSLTAHSLRHTFATRLVENGVPLMELQLHLRHQSPKTSLIYIQSERKRMRDTVAAVDLMNDDIMI